MMREQAVHGHPGSSRQAAALLALWATVLQRCKWCTASTWRLEGSEARLEVVADRQGTATAQLRRCYTPALQVLSTAIPFQLSAFGPVPSSAALPCLQPKNCLQSALIARQCIAHQTEMLRAGVSLVGAFKGRGCMQRNWRIHVTRIGRDWCRPQVGGTQGKAASRQGQRAGWEARKSGLTWEPEAEGSGYNRAGKSSRENLAASEGLVKHRWRYGRPAGGQLR